MALDPLTAGLSLGSDIVTALEKWIPDPNARAALVEQIQSQMLTVSSASDTNQTTVDAAEATAVGWFNKPHLALEWLCIVSLVVQMGHNIWAGGFPLTADMWPVLIGAFGLSGVRVVGGVMGALKQ